jgi:sugar lactone lactonase YvrE
MTAQSAADPGRERRADHGGEAAEIEVPGLTFPEGPRWRGDALWFSDHLGTAIHRIVPDTGEQQVVAEIDHPSGLGWTTDGALLAVTMHDPAVVRIEDGEVREVADLRPLTTHVNDMYVDPQGRAYIDAHGDEYNMGSLLLVVPGQEPVVAAPDLAFPNGIALTPDGRTLLVSETFAEHITAYDVAADGSLSGRRVWAQVPGSLPDGLCLDAEGAVWFGSARRAEFIRVREGGEVTDRITTPGRWALAPALGGADGRTLFMCTAQTRASEYLAGKAIGHLQTQRVEVPGIERP